MKIVMAGRCIKEFGALDGIRIAMWKLRQTLRIPFAGKNSIRKIKSKRMDCYIYVRPNSSDILLLLDFFCRKFEDGRGEYDIDFSDKCKEVHYIIDAGANIGLFSLLYSRLYPRAQIIAIEPEKENYQLLLKNTEYIKNIVCMNAGIWNRNTDLRIVDRKTGAWGFAVQELERGKSEKDKIKGVTIPSILEQYSFPRIDILKMDIEGAEYEVFQKDTEKWLKKTKALIIETHDRIMPGCDELVTDTMKRNQFLSEIHGENRIFLNSQQ